jgi:hypothetical protein
LIRKVFDVLGAESKNRSARFVNSLQAVKKIAGRHAPGQPKTGSLGNRSVRDSEQTAFIIPNALISSKGSCCTEHQQSGNAASRKKQQAHQEFLATGPESLF